MVVYGSQAVGCVPQGQGVTLPSPCLAGDEVAERSKALDSGLPTDGGEVIILVRKGVGSNPTLVNVFAVSNLLVRLPSVSVRMH